MEVIKEEGPTQDVHITEPKYDPNKKYSWGVDTNFVLNGAQFGLILNTLRAVVSTDEAIKILMADKACKAIEDIMAVNVATGNVKEAQ